MVDGGPIPSSMPSAAVLHAMQQSVQSDPTQRLCGMLPPLGFSIGNPNGLMNARLNYSRGGGNIGPLAFMSQTLKQCFVSMDTMKSWTVAGVEAGHIYADGIPIQAPHIEGQRIEGQRIEGQQISAAAASVGFADVGGGHISAPKISAPAPAASANVQIG